MDPASVVNVIVGFVNAAAAAYLLVYRTKREDTQADAAAKKKQVQEDTRVRKQEVREEVDRRTDEMRRNLDLVHADNAELAKELADERRVCAEERAKSAKDRERLARLEAWRDWMEAVMLEKGIRFPAFNPESSATMPQLPPGDQP